MAKPPRYKWAAFREITMDHIKLQEAATKTAYALASAMAALMIAFVLASLLEVVL